MSKAKELKLRVTDMDAFMACLETLKAIRGDHLHVRNVYFNQPADDVLKISEDETGNFLVRLRRSGEGFDLVASEPIDDVDETRIRLAKEFGEKSELLKEETYFTVPSRSYDLIVTMVQDRGCFVVIQDDNPTIEVAINDLGIDDPEVITVPFDEVPVHRK